MVNKWQEVSLGDIFDVKHGFAFKGEFFTNEDSPTVLVTPGNFAVGGGFQNPKPKFYDGPLPEDYILKPGEIIVTMTDLSKQADTLGYAAIVPQDENLWLHNQRVGLLEFKESVASDPVFINYLLRSHEYRSWVVGSASGTTVKHTSPNRIQSYKCRIPPIEEQRTIAHILGSLDDKIELNRRMNETLEAIAQALFKSWFIDFGPVIDNALAAGNPIPEEIQPRAAIRESLDDARKPLPDDVRGLFPEEFGFAEDVGWIPKGWEGGCIGDIGENPRRGIQPTEIESGTPYIGLQDMPQQSISLSSWGNSDSVESTKFKFNRGEILFGKLRPYFHKVGIAPVGGVCSTDILIVLPKAEEWFSVLLGHLTSVEFIEYVTRSSSGTRMPRTNWKDMSDYEIAIPPESLARVLTKQLQPQIEKLLLNIKQSRELEKLRDTLLPKLLSGELRIPDAEKMVEEVV